MKLVQVLPIFTDLFFKSLGLSNEVIIDDHKVALLYLKYVWRIFEVDTFAILVLLLDMLVLKFQFLILILILSWIENVEAVNGLELLIESVRY